MRFFRTALFLLSAWLALPLSASATNTTIFVVTDCANNGNGTSTSCAASPGGAGAYTTLDNAITGFTPKNLVTNTTNLTIDLRGATADTSTGDTSVFTTNTTWTLTEFVQVANRHLGYIDLTKYHIQNGNNPVVPMNTNTQIIDGLQIIANGTNNAVNNMGIKWLDSNTMNSGNGIVRNNLIIKTGSSTAAAWGVFFNPTPANIPAGSTPLIYNNGIQGFTNGIRCVTSFAVNCHTHVNTIRSVTSIGLELFRFDTTSGLHYWDNLLQQNGTDFSLTGTDGTLDHGDNMTSDTTSPDGASFKSKTVTFGPFGSTDFRIGTGTQPAVDACHCISISCTGKVPTFDDFVGTTRPVVDTWDCGANERIGSGPVTLAFHSLSALGVGN